MASDPDEQVTTSSVVLKAMDAKTFNELESFVKDLEGRPTERLLNDLPELLSLAESKVQIISFVLATRFRYADTEERNAIRQRVVSVAENAPDGEQHDRAQRIAERLRGLANVPVPPRVDRPAAR